MNRNLFLSLFLITVVLSGCQSSDSTTTRYQEETPSPVLEYSVVNSTTLLHVTTEGLYTLEVETVPIGNYAITVYQPESPLWFVAYQNDALAITVNGTTSISQPSPIHSPKPYSNQVLLPPGYVALSSINTTTTFTLKGAINAIQSIGSSADYVRYYTSTSHHEDTIHTPVAGHSEIEIRQETRHNVSIILTAIASYHSIEVSIGESDCNSEGVSHQHIQAGGNGDVNIYAALTRLHGPAYLLTHVIDLPIPGKTDCERYS